MNPLFKQACPRTRGVTPFELAAVTGAIALLAVAGTLILRPRLAAADTDAAIKDATRIFDAAQTWRRDHASGCPTLSELVHEKRLDSSARMDDPWGERYRVRCDGDEMTIVSPGQDHELNTKDDIRVPRSAS